MISAVLKSGLVTLWRKTCPDIEEEAPTTGSHKNLPINKQCKNTWKYEGDDDSGDKGDVDACVVGLLVCSLEGV